MAASGNNRLVTVIGGSGFVGRQLVRALAKRGYRIRVACRRPDLALQVMPSGTPGQIALVQANIRYPQSLVAVCEGAYAVVNLVGVLNSSGAQTFDAVHAFGAQACAHAARQAGAEVFVQMSALGADSNSASAYAVSKAEGERRAISEFPSTQIVRPSIIFGSEDNFFNQFGGMARFSPVLPLIGGGTTTFQPVFVGDVADAIATLIDRGAAPPRVYDLGGTEKISFRGILEYVLHVTQRKRLFVPLPWPVAKTIANITGFLPKAPLTSDQVALLRNDNVVSDAAVADKRTLEGLGVKPNSFRTIVPGYLYRYRAAGQFTAPRGMPE